VKDIYLQSTDKDALLADLATVSSKFFYKDENNEDQLAQAGDGFAIDYIGVMGIELFDMGADSEGKPELLVNEVAPRVHNTGHWTQDGCVCDQFEQHIRAVAGWPLGPTSAHARVEMKNLLGDEVDQWRALSAKADERLHLYGKAEARPGRKMAHVNRVLGTV
jgi:5-(carboxyamino)imidazole ribonucleotide synthase